MVAPPYELLVSFDPVLDGGPHEQFLLAGELRGAVDAVAVGRRAPAGAHVDGAYHPRGREHAVPRRVDHAVQAVAPVDQLASVVVFEQRAVIHVQHVCGKETA